MRALARERGGLFDKESDRHPMSLARCSNYTRYPWYTIIVASSMSVDNMSKCLVLIFQQTCITPH